jgi:hypothetical protein
MVQIGIDALMLNEAVERHEVGLDLGSSGCGH